MGSVQNFCGTWETVSSEDTYKLSQSKENEILDDLLKARSAKVIQSNFRIKTNKLKSITSKIDQYRKEFRELVINKTVNIIEEEDFIDKQLTDAIKRIKPSLQENINKIKKKCANTKEFTFEEKPIRFDDFVYKGSWNLSYKKHGFGELLYDNGNLYIGEFSNDLVDSEGVIFFKDGNYYAGGFLNEMHDGKGVLFIQGLSTYTGSFKCNMQHGYGEEQFANGGFFKGNYLKGEKEGEGQFHFPNGDTYQGNFLHSDIHGNGRFHWNDGREYIGEWKNNKMNGNGKFTWPNGTKYIGEYLNDSKHGDGTFFWSDNCYFRGKWINSRRHGDGLIFYNEQQYSCSWRYDKLIKKSINLKEVEVKFDNSTFRKITEGMIDHESDSPFENEDANIEGVKQKNDDFFAENNKREYL